MQVPAERSAAPRGASTAASTHSTPTSSTYRTIVRTFGANRHRHASSLLLPHKTKKMPPPIGHAQERRLSSEAPLTSWAAAAAAVSLSSAGKPTKLHELIASCSALPTHNDEGDDNYDDDEEFGGGSAISVWQPVMNRIHAHPSECTQKDLRQRSPLHCAVARLPPPCIVRALIEAAASTTNGLDSRGSTPLNRAAEHGASAGVIRALLLTNPDAASIPDRSGRLPLHWSCCNGFNPSSSVEGTSATTTPSMGSASQHAIRMKKQKREIVRLLLEAYPEGASRADLWHRRPLDEAINSRCCPDIVEMLVRAYPAAAVSSNDQSGCTPLVSAIQNGLGAEIIRLLVDANPSALDFPLRKALEYQASPQVISVLAIDAETVESADSTGRCSLHFALEFSANNFSVVKMLLLKAPKAALLPNKQGQTPLGLAYLHFCRSVRGVKISREILQISEVLQCWQTTLSLLRAATNGTIQDDEGERSKEEKGKADEFKILHSILRTEVSTKTALPLVQAAMAYRPAEVMEVDNGSTALSCAICGPMKNSKSRIVDTLLDSNAHAARVADMNDNLRFPLQQAALRSTQIKGTTLVTLMDCYPDAIFFKDPILGLYPFQLAALPQTDDRSGSKDDHSLRDRYLLWGFEKDNPNAWHQYQIERIFILLRAAPSLISHDMKKRGSNCTN